MHYGVNIKLSNLIHMYTVIAKGVDETESLQTLYKIQNPDENGFAILNLWK